jgi:hypothetical protein
MPEAAINEYRYSCGGECDVRSSWEVRVIDPESEAPTV